MKRSQINLVGVVFVLYLIVLMAITLRSPTGSTFTPDLVPLRGLVREISRSATPELVLRNTLGNVVLLMPLAYFVTHFRPNWSTVKIVGAVAAVSFTIELVQVSGLISGRVGSVDDIMLNVAGAGIVIILLKRIRRRRRFASSPSDSIVPDAGRR